MAEKNIQSKNGACSVPDCVLHLEGETTSSGPNVDGTKGPKKVRKFRTHFTAWDLVYWHANESMQRVVAYRERIGKGLPDRAATEHVDIDHKGNFVETLEDRLKKLESMSPEELAAQAALFQKMLEAAQKAQSLVKK